MPALLPLNFKAWIEENRSQLKPPVGNKLVWEDREFIIMVVGGPNSRTDYHINAGEEFFYQVEGDIVVRVIEDGKPKDVPIKEGEIFLLPPNVPHSPRRPANTVGLVIERKRRQDEQDGLVWLCDNCDEKLYEERFHLTDIVKQFPPIFERFYESENSTCTKCGTQAMAPK
ncbi:MAG: 3-hydroxyanthranilate 3,4-dioxygenase [Candidatus Melainabacteria bacterium]|nr:3-hydroxyanthranilate 3,4-dioxygenase [Candidatus Melainabacteria bacterium]